MSVRAKIEQQMKAVSKQYGGRLALLRDDLLLVDSGLDSLALAVLVSRLEDELGVDPFAETSGDDFPETLGEFVQFYERAMV
jgi:acyl carrier protein